MARRAPLPRSLSCCWRNSSIRAHCARFPALLGLVTFLTPQDPAAGRGQLAILLLGNLVGSVAAASAVLESDLPLPALALMALLGSLGFAQWIMTAGRRAGGAVAFTGLVTFLMLFGLGAAPVPVDIPVLDRVADIGLLSLYTVGATTLLLPPPVPRWRVPWQAVRRIFRDLD